LGQTQKPISKFLHQSNAAISPAVSLAISVPRLGDTSPTCRLATRQTTPSGEEPTIQRHTVPLHCVQNALSFPFIKKNGPLNSEDHLLQRGCIVLCLAS
jgi:hypothetical protein